MQFKSKLLAALVAVAASGAAMAVTTAETGGFAAPTAGGLPVYDASGNVVGSTLAGARVKYAATLDEMNAIVQAGFLNDAGKKISGGAYPLLIVYSGNEDSLIANVVAGSTIDPVTHKCPAPHWSDAYREVPLKDYTAGITIIGTNGSSANFGITIVNSGNVIVRNMKIGALGGASNDADMFRVDNSSNVWIDHNEMFAVNNECAGSPDGDLTFESAIDVKKNSQNVTFSYNYIHDSKKVGLDGHTQSGGSTDFQRTITYHHNVYYNVNARLPLQRGGIVHAYNNLYNKITSSGINVRASGKAIIERNWFENSQNPVTCRYDTTGCGTWYLDSNNTTSAASNATYGITWDNDGGAAGTLNADTWTSTLTAKPSLTYTYEPLTAQCVKDKLALVAGVGKEFRNLAAADCTGPVLIGTGEIPVGFVKCADEGGVCTVASGDGWVSYGRNGKWATKQIAVGRGVKCNALSFGRDPGGSPNICAYRPTGTVSAASSSTATSSAASSSSSAAASSAASSSTAASSSSAASSSAATVTTLVSDWTEEFTTNSATTFFSTGYAAITTGSSTVPVYVGTSGTPTFAASATSGAGYVLGMNGIRFTVGALGSTSTTSSSTPGGMFDIIGKACTLNINFAAAGTGSSNFQVQVDNNTTSGGNSILGTASRVVSVAANTITAGVKTYTFSLAAPTANYTAGQGSFLMFRTESGAAVSIESFNLSCQ